MERPTEGLVDGVVYVVADRYPDENVLVAADEVAEADEHQFGTDALIGGGGEIVRIKHGYMVSLGSHLARAKIASLEALLRLGLPRSMNPDRIYVHKGDAEITQELLDLDDRTYLRPDSLGICACVEDRYPRRPSTSRAKYREMAEAVAESYGCRISDVRYSDIYGDLIDEGALVPNWLRPLDDDEDDVIDWFADRAHVVETRIVCDDEDARVGRLINCGQALHDYFAAIRGGGELDAPTIVKMLRSGHVGLLVGRQESGHLEIKQGQYNINAPGVAGEKQKIELAQDVARFANSDKDAVLVLGYIEKRSGGISTVGQPAPFDLAQFDISQYQAVLDSRIIPPISGLVIEKSVVDYESNAGIVFIFVPRQPEEMQPYLVQGTIVGDKTEGAFFSIVQRRGEASMTLGASQIHGYIVAGKAFLRRSAQPDS